MPNGNNSFFLGNPKEEDPAMKVSENRRTFERFALDLPVRFKSDMLDFDGQAVFLEGEIADMSRGGVFIRSDFFELPGTQVNLELIMPRSKERIKLEGHVAWVVEEPPKGPGMGIQLKGEPLANQILDRFMKLWPSV